MLHTDPVAVSFQFLSGVDAWCKMCSEGGLPSEMQDLELAIHHHQSLYEQVTQAYTEVRTRQDTQGSRVCVDVGAWREHWVGVGRRERPLLSLWRHL